jgi:hypothetical protein
MYHLPFAAKPCRVGWGQIRKKNFPALIRSQHVSLKTGLASGAESSGQHWRIYFGRFACDEYKIHQKKWNPARNQLAPHKDRYPVIASRN